MRLPWSNLSIQHSSHNGWIVVTPKGVVWALGGRQTSLGYGAMWGDALTRAEIQGPISSVLMLGLAGGGALKPLHKLFPGVDITAVDYDPKMALVARSLLRNASFPFPKVITADAQDVLANLTHTFDLIVVDIFIGLEPSPLIHSETFWTLLKTRLAPNAKVLLNVAGHSTQVYEAQKHFSQCKTWQSRANTFCALSQETPLR